MDIFLAFPYLLLAIIIVAALGAGLINTIVAIAVWTTPSFARVVRSAVLQLKERDFVTAALSLGAKDARIMALHLLPNFGASIAVFASLNMAHAILMESALSFLGLGVQPPTASWAGMIASGRNYVTSAPHIATIPGIAIALAVLGFNLLGDALRDVLDPRGERR
jgi:peptide/nickel transport system permease protein